MTKPVNAPASAASAICSRSLSGAAWSRTSGDLRSSVMAPLLCFLARETRKASCIPRLGGRVRTRQQPKGARQLAKMAEVAEALQPALAEIHDARLAGPPDVEGGGEVDGLTAARRFVGHHLLLGDVHTDVDAGVQRATAQRGAGEVAEDLALHVPRRQGDGVTVGDAQVLDRRAIGRRLKVALDHQRLAVAAEEDGAV